MISFSYRNRVFWLCLDRKANSGRGIWFELRQTTNPETKIAGPFEIGAENCIHFEHDIYPAIDKYLAKKNNTLV